MDHLTRAMDLANAINQTILGCYGRFGFSGCTEPTPQAKEAAFCALKHARSQHVEDLLLLPTLLLAAEFQPGVFVELGALDGNRYSNTIVLERCFNWTGILIEANPSNFAKLARSTRKAVKVHSGVCSGIGSVRMTAAGFEEAADVDALPEPMLQGMLYRKKLANTTIDVPCRSLTSIMQDTGFPAADFLSLDVQGAEYKVLAAAQPQHFKVILVETYGVGINDVRFGENGKTRLQLIHERMAGGGLQLASRVRIPGSDLYVRPNVKLVPVRQPYQSLRLREKGVKIIWCARSATPRGEWWLYCDSS